MRLVIQWEPLPPNMEREELGDVPNYQWDEVDKCMFTEWNDVRWVQSGFSDQPGDALRFLNGDMEHFVWYRIIRRFRVER